MSSADSVREPENWPREFTARLAAGRLDDILAMYEPGARMLSPPSGEMLVGHAQIRHVVAELIRSHGKLESHVVRSVVSGDICVLYTDFEGSRVDAVGNTQPIHQQAIEVLRRQPDGTWKLIFGDPLARGRLQATH